MHDDEESKTEREPENQQDFDSNTDPNPEGTEGKLNVKPGPAGLSGRDPDTDMMPRVPSAPEAPNETDD